MSSSQFFSVLAHLVRKTLVAIPLMAFWFFLASVFVSIPGFAFIHDQLQAWRVTSLVLMNWIQPVIFLAVVWVGMGFVLGCVRDQNHPSTTPERLFENVGVVIDEEGPSS